ncbi:hypothetical protein RR47_GL001414 [Enterococcus columbae DSM 7374 = ATCC 51263]|nr:hypothetical protein RR47_GL001414 [Enterococcus columbae DSM 7374 = ATCC 51263]
MDEMTLLIEQMNIMKVGWIFAQTSKFSWLAHYPAKDEQL